MEQKMKLGKKPILALYTAGGNGKNVKNNTNIVTRIPLGS